METKTILVILSFPTMWASDKFMPVSWYFDYFEISVATLAISIYATYNAVLIFSDWDQICSVGDAVVSMGVVNIKKWWFNLV